MTAHELADGLEKRLADADFAVEISGGGIPGAQRVHWPLVLVTKSELLEVVRHLRTVADAPGDPTEAPRWANYSTAWRSPEDTKWIEDVIARRRVKDEDRLRRLDAELLCAAGGFDVGTPVKTPPADVLVLSKRKLDAALAGLADVAYRPDEPAADVPAVVTGGGS